MQIQINTDKNITGGQRLSDYLETVIKDGLERFSDRITRVEAHLSDEDGSKEGQNDIKCVLEARIAGRPPIAVTNKANENEKAVHGAIEKLQSALKTMIEKSSA
ncbi:MAG: HPF/RaiA family ribosome-associated protein [Chitinophagaceae bacterium]|nr:MAG: HPF/RaiA family ribosome-associated protein [Chitinophagaceae bacterium]